jgi:hypothetical protein
MYIIILVLIYVVPSFCQNNADYFPYKTGDMWEYTLYFWPDIDTLQTLVIDDSTDDDGNIYTTYFSRAINPIEPPSALLLDTIVYMIDTNLYVYGPGFEKWGNIYRLNGKAGDQWVFWDYSHGGGGPYEMARIDSISDIIIFGDTTKIMFMRYYSANDSTDTLGIFARYYDQLLKGLGFYFRGAAELDAQLYLHGAVIDGILYGDTTVVSVEKLNDETPSEFGLKQNFPNPFNPQTKIKFYIPERIFVKLKIFDALGNELETLVNEETDAGNYEVVFKGSDLPSGIYFYTLQTPKFSQTKKMVLLR